MRHVQFTGYPYYTRRGRAFAHPFRWWVRLGPDGWWAIVPPVTNPDWRMQIKRFPPGTYWTHVIPYLNSKGTSDVRTGS